MHLVWMLQVTGDLLLARFFEGINVDRLRQHQVGVLLLEGHNSRVHMSHTWQPSCILA